MSKCSLPSRSRGPTLSQGVPCNHSPLTFLSPRSGQRNGQTETRPPTPTQTPHSLPSPENIPRVPPWPTPTSHPTSPSQDSLLNTPCPRAGCPRAGLPTTPGHDRHVHFPARMPPLSAVGLGPQQPGPSSPPGLKAGLGVLVARHLGGPHHGKGSSTKAGQGWSDAVPCVQDRAGHRISGQQTLCSGLAA